MFVPGLRHLALSGVCLLVPFPAVRGQEAPPAADRWNRAAQEWIGLLRSARFEDAAGRVDPAVPEGAMSAERLRTIWEEVGGQLGSLLSLEPGPVLEREGYHIVDMPARFERQALTVRVVLTEKEEVSGFFLRPPEPPPYEAPAYVDRTAFREVDVAVGSDPWTLPGTLTLPVGEGPFPVVVLVHGSGPNDRDETLAGNRPFRDLAWGLTSRGVAVLRYDKRTRVYGASLSREITLEEEVIEDALAALRVARDHPSTDPERTFLLGHSLGGLLAPEIARRDGRVAGVVLLAAPARPITRLLREQILYVSELPGQPPGARARADSILAHLDRYDAGELGEEEDLLGVPVSYWRELDAVRPVETARDLRVPLLVLQGGRDYQVTREDFRLWEEGLRGREGVVFRTYPDLNHLFARGSGTATPEEYTTEVKHVAVEVVEDLARWIEASAGGGG